MVALGWSCRQTKQREVATKIDKSPNGKGNS